MASLALAFDLIGRDKSASKSFKDVGDAADDAGRRGERFGAGMAKLGGVATAAFAGVAAIGVGGLFKDAIAGASDLNETTTKIEAIFGKASVAVQDFAKGGPRALGQSRQAVLDAAANFGTFGKAAGLGGKDLAKFSTGFASLSTDLASFNNTSPEEAVEALGAALRGEAEPMRRFGVLLNDVTMREEAFKLGLISTTKQALTPQQKVLAAQAVIYKQTKDAQGDFAKTSGGLANQQRILAAQFTDVKAVLGQKLLPVAVQVAQFLTNNMIPMFQKVGGVLGEFVKDAMPAVSAFIQTKLLPAFQQVSAFIRDNLMPVVTSLATFFVTKIVPAVQQVAEKVGGGLRAAFDTIGQKIRENRPQLEALGATLLKVAGFIADKVAPVLGFVLGNGLKVAGTAIGVFIGIIGKVVGAFQKVKDIASGIGGAIKGAFDAVRLFVIRTLNNMIDGVNSLIRQINRLPKVNIDEIGRISSVSQGNVQSGGAKAGSQYDRLAAPVTVNVQGSVVTENDLVDAIRTGLVRTAQRNGGSALGGYA